MMKSAKQVRNARAAEWLIEGPVPIGDLVKIVVEYANGLEGECVLDIKSQVGSVYSIAALSGNLLAMAGESKNICVFDSDGVPRGTLDGHTGRVRVLCALSDGRLASGSYDKTIRIWNTDVAMCLITLVGHSDSVEALAILPEGQLASGSHDKTIRIWDVDVRCSNEVGGVCIRVLTGHTESVGALAVMRGTLASGSNDTAIRLWDVATGICLRTLEGRNTGVNSLVVLPGGRLASGSYDGTVSVWDVDGGAEAPLLKLVSHNDSIRSLAVLPGGQLVSGSTNGMIRVWDVDGDGICSLEFKRPGSYMVSLAVLPGVAEMPASFQLVSGSVGKQECVLWD